MTFFFGLFFISKQSSNSNVKQLALVLGFMLVMELCSTLEFSNLTLFSLHELITLLYNLYTIAFSWHPFLPLFPGRHHVSPDIVRGLLDLVRLLAGLLVGLPVLFGEERKERDRGSSFNN